MLRPNLSMVPCRSGFPGLDASRWVTDPSAVSDLCCDRIAQATGPGDLAGWEPGPVLCGPWTETGSDPAPPPPAAFTLSQLLCWPILPWTSNSDRPISHQLSRKSGLQKSFNSFIKCRGVGQTF